MQYSMWCTRSSHVLQTPTWRGLQTRRSFSLQRKSRTRVWGKSFVLLFSQITRMHRRRRTTNIEFSFFSRRRKKRRRKISKVKDEDGNEKRTEFTSIFSASLFMPLDFLCVFSFLPFCWRSKIVSRNCISKKKKKLQVPFEFISICSFVLKSTYGKR